MIRRTNSVYRRNRPPHQGRRPFRRRRRGLAARFGVSPAIIGFTVIAFGTSLPEFVVSVNAVIANDTGIALGNVLGSNIANIALVLALCAFIRPALVSGGMANLRETALMLAATGSSALSPVRVLDLPGGTVALGTCR